jgi:hypothetical protein
MVLYNDDDEVNMIYAGPTLSSGSVTNHYRYTIINQVSISLFFFFLYFILGRGGVLGSEENRDVKQG